MPPMATAADTESPTRVGRNRLAKYGLLTVLVAVVVNALVRVIALPVIDILHLLSSEYGEFDNRNVLMKLE